MSCTCHPGRLGGATRAHKFVLHMPPWLSWYSMGICFTPSSGPVIALKNHIVSNLWTFV